METKELKEIIALLLKSLDIEVTSKKGNLWTCKFKEKELKIVWGWRTNFYIHNKLAKCLTVDKDRLECNPDIVLLYCRKKFYFSWYRDIKLLRHFDTLGRGLKPALAFPVVHFCSCKLEETGMLDIYKSLEHGPRQGELL